MQLGGITARRPVTRTLCHRRSQGHRSYQSGFVSRGKGISIRSEVVLKRSIRSNNLTISALFGPIGKAAEGTKGKAGLCQIALPETQEVSLRRYDTLGRQVRTVVQSDQESRHERALDGGGLPSGVYFLRLSAAGQTRTRKIRTRKATVER
jgi:hypothetical protein